MEDFELVASTPAEVDACLWCLRPKPAKLRSLAKYCSKSCRQAAWKFRRNCPRRARADSQLRLAFADPPYVGKAHYYREHPDYGGEVDHVELVDRLRSYDGWALSLSKASLREIWNLCPEAELAVWVRGERPTKHWRPLNAYEPVLYWGGRAYLSPADDRRTDVLERGVSPRTSDPARVIGTKPADFAWWMFALLGALPGDEFDDLYPGSGGIARAWRCYSLAGGQPIRVAARAETGRSCGAGES